MQEKILKVRPGKDYMSLSVSKLKTFQQCSARFKFQYIEKLPKVEQYFQAFGSFSHEVLENFENFIIAGDNRPDNEILTESYRKALVNWQSKLTKEQKDEIYKMMNVFLKKRNQWKSQSKLYKPLVAEKEFFVDVNGVLLLNGLIDLVALDPDGVLHIIDYKTSSTDKYLKKDLLQLKTYAYVSMLEDQDLEKVRCSYMMLKQEFDLITKEYSREEISSIGEYYWEQSEKIKAEKLYRPSVGPLCKYCDFIKSCPDGNNKYGSDEDKEIGQVEW